MARDNGSLRTLESAFSLNDLGSIMTVSSLSSDPGDDESSTKNENRMKFVFSTAASARHQRQNRRTSYQFGRRRRRFGTDRDDSMGKSEDDFTEEELTVDGDVPNIPNLPKKASDHSNPNKSSYSGSGDEFADDVDEVTMEEVTVDDIETSASGDEYFEELLNDTSTYNDDSTKRYEILISEESFEEEIIVEVEEEEVTLDDGDREVRKLDRSTRLDEVTPDDGDLDITARVTNLQINGGDDSSKTHKSIEMNPTHRNDQENESDPPYVGDKTEYAGNNGPVRTDAKSECSEDGHDDNGKDTYHNMEKDSQRDDDNKSGTPDQEKSELSATVQVDGDKEAPTNVEENLESTANSESDDGSKALHPDVQKELESNVNNGDDDDDDDGKEAS